jgi:MFS family permease
MCLGALEATVVSTAMPTVVASLGGLDQFSWVFAVYQLTSTVTMPLWGRLSDLHGRRMVYLAGVAIFMVGSTLSGFAGSMPTLIAFRALQGLGAGALLPLGMTIIGDIFSIKERARMQALFSGVWGLSGIVGPAVGGFITEHWSWRWVFLINIPFGLVAAAIIGIALIDPPRRGQVEIDYLGAITLTTALTVLLAALSSLGGHQSNSAGWLILASGVMGVLFVAIERRASEPILPLELLRTRLMISSSLAGVFAGVGMMSVVAFGVSALSSPAEAGGVRMFVRHEVSNYAAWRRTYDDFDATAYWCSKTQTPRGPDGERVHLESCSLGCTRACFVSLISLS